MFDSADDFRKGRARSLLSVAPAGADDEDVPPTSAAYRDDAVLRHQLARARRERRPNPLLAAPVPQHGHAPGEEPLFSDDSLPEPAVSQADAQGARGWIEALVSRLGARTGPEPAEQAVQETAPQPQAEPAEPEQTYVQQEQPRKSRLPAIAGMTAAGAALGTALALAWPGAYVATSEVLIDPRAAQATGTAAPLSSDAAFALVDNQLRVLRSGSMLNAAAERLNLAADAEFNGTAAGFYGLGALAAGLGDLLSGDGSSAIEMRRRHVVDGLADAVEVERVTGSSVVRISASTADPQKSALIANTIAELFVGGADGGSAEAGQANARLTALRSALDEAERAVERFKAENDLIDAQGRLITDDEILRLNERLSAARARTVELNARAASARDANVDSIVTGSLPEQFASPTVTELRARHAGLKQQLDRLSVKLGPRHPERLAAQAELEGARQEMQGELRRVAASLQTELRRAVQQEQELAGELARMKTRQAGIGDEMVELRQLEREAEARRTAYESALHAARSGGMVSAPGAASLISRAEPPLRATGSSLAGFSLAGALAGFGAGVGLSGRRDTRDRRERLPEATEDDASIDDTFTGKEADDMHSYSAYPQHDPAAQPQVQQPAPAHAAYPQAAPVYYAPAQHPAQPQAYAPPAPWAAAHHPVPQPQPHPQPAYPAAYYPAPPPPAYGAMPPHDPWAHQRAYAPPPPAYAAAPAYPPAQPLHTVVYVPVPQAPSPVPPTISAEPRQQPERRTVRASLQRRAANEDVYDADPDADERTSAAIEEIRNSLREFREAVEDFAQDRRGHRRFGT